MQDAKLIPTWHKDKIGRGLSYPLGAAEVSAICDAMPGFEACQIAFRERSIYFLSKFSAAVRAGENVVIFTLEKEFKGEHINITVYSTPAAIKTEVRDQLFHLLPAAVKAWFGQSAERCRRLDVYVNMNTGKCRVEP